MIVKTCGCCGRVFSTANDFLKGTSSWRVCQDGNLWFNCACDSTLMLPKGKYPWYDPQAGLSPEARSVFNEVSARSLPHPPAAVMRLLQVVESETSTAAQLEQAVRESPALAMSVLKLANGAAAHEGTTIRSLEHAISSLGRTVLKQMVIAAPLESLTFATQSFSREQYWNEARRTAHVAGALCRRLRPKESADEAFIAGFLADLGKVVQAICYPDVADRLQARVADPLPPCSWIEAEALEHAPKHEVLGEIAASLWGLPSYVRNAATYHHRALPAKVLDKGPCELAAFAVQVGHWAFEEPERVDSPTFHRLCQVFGLSESDVYSFMGEIKAEIMPRASHFS